jgi:uncharacterized protein YfaS (alpha-2-macroglobulin family)
MAQDGQAKQQGGQGPRNRRLWLAGGGLTVLILGLIILISPLSPFNTPTPTPGPGETPVATPSPEVPGTPPPSPTPGPTAVPTIIYSYTGGDGRPHVSGITAGVGMAGYDLAGAVPIAVSFSAAMNTGTAQTAFALADTAGKTVAGAFNWAAADTLIFTPSTTLAPSMAYTVSVSSAATTADGATLAAPALARFVTAPPPSILRTLPAADAREVPTDTLISIQFNRPMIPLTALNAQPDVSRWVSISPAVPGRFVWLGTATLGYRPAAGFQPSTTYKVAVQPGLPDAGGVGLPGGSTWQFTTIRPDVLSVSPPNSAEQIDRDAPLVVRFNQAMDHASAQAALRITPNVQGQFSWSPASDVMTYTPSSLLPFATAVRVRLEGRLAPAQGDAIQADANTLSWSFTTVEQTHMVSSQPSKERDNAPGSGLAVGFNNALAPGQDFGKLITVNPRPAGFLGQWELDPSGHAVMTNVAQLQPDTVYRFEVKEGLKDRYGAPVKAESWTAKIGPLPPDIALQGGMFQPVYADAPLRLEVQAPNLDQFTATLYRLSENDLRQVLNPSYNGGSPAVPGTRARTWTVQVPGGKGPAKPFWVTVGPDGAADRLPPGYWVLEATAPAPSYMGPEPLRDYVLFVSGRTALTLKEENGNELVWAVDLGSGKPKPNYPVRVVRWGNGAPVAPTTGTTGADGVARLTLPANQGDDSYRTVVLSGDPNDVALVTGNWSQGIEPYSFGVSSAYGPQAETGKQRYTAAIYTDRPIYRPAQTVYFRGILRQDDDARYSLPPTGARVDVSVMAQKAGAQVIYHGQAALSPAGTFDGQFTLPADAPTGEYTISFTPPNGIEATNSAGFSVEEYRKPDFQVSVQPAQPAVIAGDRLNATVQTSYYFGGPVANMTTTLTLRSQPYYYYWTDPDTGETYSFNDVEWDWRIFTQPGDNSQEWTKVWQAQTGADGTLTVDMSSPITTTDHSKTVSLEAQVQDLSNQAVANRASAVVHQGAYYVGVRTEGYIATARQPMTVSLRTVAPDANAPSGGRIQPNTRVHLRYLRTEWRPIPLAGAPYGVDWQREDKPVGEADVTTDATGRAGVQFSPPQAGSYRIEATSTDARGHLITSSTTLWVSDSGAGSAFWQQDNPYHVNLVADKKLYKVGDTAHILVTSPYTQATGLLTVERGHLRRYYVVDLRGGAPTVDVPLEAGDLPNVYVGLTIMGLGVPQTGVAEPNGPPPGLTMRQGYVNLSLDTSGQKLEVSLEPQGTTFEPGSTASVVVRTRTEDGAPHPANLSLAVVDEAIYALAAERAPDLLATFYGERGLEVQTATSFSGGDYGPFPTRHGYGAYDSGFAAGGAIGSALVPGAPPAATAQRNATDAKTESAALDEQAPQLRTDFRDTAFWKADVTTGADGTATVQIPLPDNLTTWRLTTQGGSPDPQLIVGNASTPITVTKPLLLRPIAPRFLTTGDRAQPQAIVHNSTNSPLTVEVNLQVSGAAAYSMNVPPTRTLTVPAGQELVATWAIEVSQGTTVTLRYEARATGGLGDALAVTVPVVPLVAPEAVATSGEVGDKVDETVFLPYGINPQLGELVVQVAPSLAAGTAAGVNYVKEYPYEGTEQTVSRFLPLVTLERVYRAQGLTTPFSKELPGITERAFKRLAQLQRPDGGWGWWENDPDSNAFLTAYAVQGLAAAQRAGYQFDTGMLDRGKTRLLQFLQENQPAGLSNSSDLNLRAYELYVLAQADPAMAQQQAADQPAKLLAQQARMSNHARAWTAIALKALGRDAEAKTLLDTLTSAAKQTSTLAHWEESTVDYYSMGTDARATALALDALVQLDPQNALIAKTVRWLMSASKDGRWLSTQETAITLVALADYMEQSRELAADYNWQVELYGKLLGQGTASAGTLTTTTTLTAPVSEMPKNVAGPLTLSRDKQQGKMYYSASLRYYLPGQGIKARSEGLAISRQYYLMPTPGSTGQPQQVSSVQAGDLVRVRLSIVVPETSYYLAVEDPLPAGLEAVNGSLGTTADSERPPNPTGTREPGVAPGKRLPPGVDAADTYFPWWLRWGPFSNVEMRDDRVALFANSVSPGTYVYDYYARATTPGAYMAQPAQARLLYFPDVFGRSDGGVFTVNAR